MKRQIRKIALANLFVLALCAFELETAPNSVEIENDSSK